MAAVAVFARILSRRIFRQYGEWDLERGQGQLAAIEVAAMSAHLGFAPTRGH
jgi:hypothetical protein